MRVELSGEQLRDLEWAARRHGDAHIRSRALAVRAVLVGELSRQQAARVFPYSAYSIGQWCRDFAEQGLQAFSIAGGRGRHSGVDTGEVLATLRQSPRNFGLAQTRWTLAALSRACPSLSGLTEPGVAQVLDRLGFGQKRGQPWIHSPDPLYGEKKRGHRGGFRAGARKAREGGAASGG